MDRIRHGVLAFGAAALLALAPAAAGTVLAETAVGNDTYVMNEGGTLVVDAPGLLANDSLDGEEPKCVAGIDASNVMGHLRDMGNTGWRSDGSFEFTPYEWWNGETSFIYGMTGLDPDGTCVGEAFGQGIVTITVRPVNDAPTAVLVYTCLNTVRVVENSGPYDDPEHCTEMHNWGPIDENAQLVEEWVVTTDRPELFSDGPEVRVFDETYGTLHFTPAPGATGLAKVVVRGRDTGGTERGGQDLSNKLTFTIRIVPESEPTPTEAPQTAPPIESEQPAPSGDLASVDPTDGATPEETETTVPGDPTGFADGAPMLIALVFVVGIIAIGAGILAPRMIRRSKEAP